MMIPYAESPDAAPAAFPGILGAGLLMLIGWTGAGLTAIATASYLGPEAVTAAASIVGISLAVWVGCRYARAPLTVVLSLRPFPMRWAWPLALMAFSGSFLGAELANWVHRIIPLPEAYQKLFMQLLQQKLSVKMQTTKVDQEVQSGLWKAIPEPILTLIKLEQLIMLIWL